MARLFSDNEFAAGVTRCSGSAPIVTAASVIAAHPADSKRGGSNDAVRTAATSRAQKDEKTIATDSGSTGSAGGAGPA